ncbi:Rrf2 family transcriptional regulator [Niabella terrae]
MFSKACEYGIKAMTYIATRSLENERVKLGDVARQTDSPEAFTAKILGTLTRLGLVQSVKGPYGGFEIPPAKMKQIRISAIVHAIDGDAVYNGCALGLKECNAAAPCPLHDHFFQIRDSLKKMLETISVYDLATQLRSGSSILVR